MSGPGSSRSLRTSPPVDRTALLARAVVVSAMSVVWSGVSGGLAVTFAIQAGSLSLLGFGVDAAIDSLASLVLIWRFRVEAREPARADRIERRAERIVGRVLLLAAASLAVGRVVALVGQHGSGRSAPALVVLLASAVVLPPLAVVKARVARSLGSGALRADAFLTAAAAFMVAVSLAGVVASAFLGLWWADAVGALVIAAILAREGQATIRRSGGALE